MTRPDLSYSDPGERLYGATGMSIAVVVNGSNELLRAAHLDVAPGDPMIELAPEYYYHGSAGAMAGAVHRHLLESFSLSIAMALANVMCREMVLHGRRVNYARRQALLEAAIADGADELGLEADETEELFSAQLSRMDRVFGHPGVQKAARVLADKLNERRSMSRLEILETLHSLGLI